MRYVAGKRMLWQGRRLNPGDPIPPSEVPTGAALRRRLAAKVLVMVDDSAPVVSPAIPIPPVVEPGNIDGVNVGSVSPFPQPPLDVGAVEQPKRRGRPPGSKNK